MAAECWHCQGAGKCACVLCGADAQGEWTSGPCVACKAKKQKDRLREILEKKNIDPRDIKHWRSEGKGGFHRVFIPAEEFQAILKTRDEQ